jgi:hypothetical protein
MPSNPFRDNSSSTLVTAAATVIAGLAVTYHFSRRVLKDQSETDRSMSQVSRVVDFMKRPFRMNILSFGDLRALVREIKKAHDHEDMGQFRESVHLRSAEAFFWYAENFLTQPHPDKGKRGVVCPFMPQAVKLNSVYMCILENEDSPNVVNELVKSVSGAFDIFKVLDPQEVSSKSILKALAFALPNVRDLDAIDEAQVRLQPIAVQHGFMVGEFHKRNETAGLNNTTWRPLRTDVPMLVIRHMVRGDIVFLKNKGKYTDGEIRGMVRVHKKIFSDSPCPHMSEAETEASTEPECIHPASSESEESRIDLSSETA